jgi:hypothetical protein
MIRPPASYSEYNAGSIVDPVTRRRNSLSSDPSIQLHTGLAGSFQIIPNLSLTFALLPPNSSLYNQSR